MAKIKVERDVTVMVGETATVHYPAGFEGTVPTDHVERIVAAGAGKRVDVNASGERPKPRPEA